jgi:phosphoenolpyruvate-protein kinase (PTS system EI component)
MTPSSIPRVRRALNEIDSHEAAGIASICLECETADEVEDLVRREFLARWPELFPAHSLPAPKTN